MEPRVWVEFQMCTLGLAPKWSYDAAKLHIWSQQLENVPNAHSLHMVFGNRDFLFSCNKYWSRAWCKLSSFNRQQIRSIESNLILGGIMTTYLYDSNARWGHSMPHTLEPKNKFEDSLKASKKNPKQMMHKRLTGGLNHLSKISSFLPLVTILAEFWIEMYTIFERLNTLKLLFSLQVPMNCL